MSNEATGVEAWIEHADWIRGLARALVQDQHEAEDLAQEAWLAALDGQRSGEGPSRGWYVAVLRNLARARLRGARRRVAREEAVARPEQVSGEHTAIDRLEIHERLVAAVRALDQPYRNIVVLRYLEALSPREIAQRTQVPLRTVHTQLQRGLQHLRARLDRDHGGDRREWLTALAPLAFRFEAPVFLGVTLMKLKGGWIAAALLLFLVVGAWLVSTRDQNPDAALSVGSAAGSGLDAQAPDTGLAEPSARTVISAPEAEGSEVSAAAKQIHGIVIGVDDKPIAGVRLGFFASSDSRAAASSETISDEAGEFEMPDPG